MSYKLKSLLYLAGFVASSIVYQNYLDHTQQPTTTNDQDSLELAQMKNHDITASMSQVGVLDFVR